MPPADKFRTKSDRLCGRSDFLHDKLMVMEPNHDDLLRETYRLSRENNKMLHAMRRSAFIGGIFKFIFYILILVVAPLWLFNTYLAPMLEQLNETMSQVRGAGSQAQSQFDSFQQAWQQFQSQFSSQKPGE